MIEVFIDGRHWEVLEKGSRVERRDEVPRLLSSPRRPANWEGK